MDSRVHKAQRLFTKMNTLLGNDYDKKMSVVGILKQFAEDHQVEKLCYTLDLILQTPVERKLLEDIRPFVPHNRKEVFDAILDTQISRRSTKSLERRFRLPDFSKGERRLVTVERQQGAFGFVLRGYNPVYIESVDPGSAADRAGLKRGDCLLKLNGLNVERASHNHLVKLLQGSGNTPTFEIMTMVDSDGDAIRPESVASTLSSSSSEEDCSWMNEAVIDREGRSFKQRAEHLLTKREREQLRMAMQTYNENRNIHNFYDSVSSVFDTPSKTTLWMYLIPKLPNTHKDFCMRRIDVPHELLLDVYPSDQLDLILTARQTRNMEADLNYDARSDVSDLNDISSFKQQLEYILTPRERLYLKNALQIYRDKRNVYNLVEDIGCIFDTPSKRTIWFYLIPLLAEQDQEVCRRLLTDSNSDHSSPSHPIHHSSPNISQNSSFSDDFIKDEPVYNAGTDDEVVTPATPKFGDVMFQNDDFKYVEIAADMLMKESAQNRRHGGVSGVGRRELSPEEDRRVWRSGTSLPDVNMSDSFDRVSPLSSDRDLSPDPDYDSTDSNSLPGSISSIDQLDLPPYPNPTSTIGSRSEIVLFQDDQNRPKSEISFRMLKELDADDPEMSELPKEVLDSNAKIVIMQETKDASRRTSMGNKSVKSQDSFQDLARDALQALDDVLDGEDILEGDDTLDGDDEVTSDMEDIPNIGPKKSIESNKDIGTNNMHHNAPVMHHNTIIPIPPPPPIVPEAPPPPVVKPNFREHHNQMYVKRLNWEKLELPNSKNTVWAQINDPSDLEDVVKYLELEHKFSTKKTISTSFRERRHQVTILHPKKSYNISILMGHLKLSVPQLRDALYAMNEEIFTPELLQQMITYAPDDDEKKRYEQYNGLTSDLTKADQFGMEMVKIPGYKDRLRAMLFKANFAEKMEEVAITMQHTIRASKELVSSKKLAKLLELVLAMGNHLNKGNRRIGQATAFKIYGLANLESTKTSDGKSTFLHVLANAVAEKFPEVLEVKNELATVPLAAKASHETINHELVELRNVLTEIQDTMDKLKEAPVRSGQVDRFHEVMEHFIAEASDHIQNLYSMHKQTQEDFSRMLEYFGESSQPYKNGKQNPYEIFKIFTEFLYKFEKAHRSNMMMRH